MHRANNAVIMQTKQLGRIETLKEKLHASEGHIQELEYKLVEQDRIIANLVGDNLEHLQDNMHLTAHITSSNARLVQMETQLAQVGTLVYGMARGALEGPSTEGSSSEARTLGVSGDAPVILGGDRDNEVVGVSLPESTREDSLIPREEGLITQMEREATEAGLGGWFNGNLEDVPESWSGSNSNMSASQD